MSRNLIQAKLIEPRQFSVPRLIAEVASFLRIPEERIEKVVPYPYQLWVHIKGVGGKFVSYRRLPIWLEKILDTIKKCSDLQILTHIKAILGTEFRKYRRQYKLESLELVIATWNQKQFELIEEKRANASKNILQQEAQQWRSSWKEVVSHCKNREFLKYTMSEIHRQKQQFAAFSDLVKEVENICMNRWNELTRLKA
jgi:hypothetical protein